MCPIFTYLFNFCIYIYVLGCRSAYIEIQHVNCISTLWKQFFLSSFLGSASTVSFQLWPTLCETFWLKTVFKINATCSDILLHHAKTCTHFMFDFCIQILSEATVYVYTHFDYTPSFSITQFFPLSQEQLNKMRKTVCVIVHTLHLHECVRGCLEGFIWVKMWIPVLIYLIFWCQYVCSNYVLQFLTHFFFWIHTL